MRAPPLPVVYFMVLLALFAAALGIHLHATTISLPLGSLSIPTIILPLLAGLNSCLHAQLTSLLSAISHVRDPTTAASRRRRRRRRTLSLVRTSTQSLQAAFAVSLATLLLQRVVPGEFMTCALENTWKRMWTTHDAAGIRAIEETLACCGFRTLKDRPWPFPHGPGGDVDMCRQRMGYTVPCEGPWRAQLRGSAGGDFAIVVIVTLMQIGNILVHAKYFGRLRPWFSETGPLIVPADDDEEGDNNTTNPRRPLLPASLSTSSQRHERAGNGHVGRIIEHEGDDDEGGQGPTAGDSTKHTNNNNGNGGGGMIYPSGIAGGATAVHGLQQQHVQEGNVWSSRRGRRGSNSSSSSNSD